MERSYIKGWKTLFDELNSDSQYCELQHNVQEEYAHHEVYPPCNQIYRALEITSFEDIKVIIVGQDPYHQPGQAHGLAFSVPKGVTPPASLKNIYKEIKNDLGTSKDMADGDLSLWAEQGVLLLNTSLTVRRDSPGSHARIGWEQLTNTIITKISQEKEHCVFILWGSHAQKKQLLIDSEKHLIITTPHPSPLSSYRGFFGSKPFSKTNQYLKNNGKKQIQW